MARGVNKVILVGNLGKDPEVRYMPNGGAVANLTIATSETWKDKQTGQNQEKTEWHRVVMFNRLGEVAGEYLKKGSQVYIEGKIQTKKWQGQDGQDRYSTEIIASEMQMLGSRAGGASDFGGAPADGGGQQYQSQPQQQAPAQQQQAPQQGQSYQQQAPQQQGQAPQQQQAPQQKNNSGFDDFDDDIPF